MTTLVMRSLRRSPFLSNSQSSSILLRSRSVISASQTSLLYQRRHDSSGNNITSSSTAHRSRVNGPITTLPPHLSVPERKNDQSTPSYLFSLGKSYVTFYKAGAKSIWTNFKASRPLQKKLDNKYDGSLAKAADAGFLDRADFQLLVRSWYDTKRVPVFALVFAICGEFTPLIVVFLTNAVPYTCRIPKQVEGDRRKMEKRRSISFRNLTTVVPETGVGVENLERMQLLHISWSLGLSSSAWDWMGGRLPGLPTLLLRRKVRRRVQYLEIDDKLILRNGGVDEMDVEEVKLALAERGIDILNRSEDQLRASLKAWLQARETAPVEKLLLTRQSVWPLATI